MKAIVVKNQYGLENIKFEEVDLPKLGNKDIRVKVNAIALNQLDIMVANGIFGNSLPHILGSDAAGTIEEIGSDVSEFKKGDRVITHFIKDWDKGSLTEYARDLRLGVGSEGVFSEYVVLPETAFVKTPHHLSDEEACTLPIAGVTAWDALTNATKLRAGETVLLQGTGGVSIFALQFAKAMGAKVIITSSSDEKLKRAKALGADEVINYKKTPQWETSVQKLTDNRGVDVVVSVSWVNISQTFKSVGMNARIASVGLLGGGNADVSTSDIIGKSIAIKGVQVGSRETFKKMNAAIAINNIHPCIDKVFPISEFKEAFDYLQSGNHFGKVVISF